MINMAYILFLGCWRRWFGGGFDYLGDNRFLQHLIGWLGTVSVLFVMQYHWIQCVSAGVCLQGLFWARSHGCCFDFGHAEANESRYNQLWYWKLIQKSVPETACYGYACDYILMTIRYTLPAILIAVILLKPVFVLSGLVVAGIYAICWIMYDWQYTNYPTEWAELFVGMATAALLVC